MSEGMNPRDIKFKLALEVVARFHSVADAKAAQDEFINRFRKGEMPEDIADISLQSETGSLPIANLLKNAGLTQSTSDAMRMIRQGAVKIDGEKIEDTRLEMGVSSTHIYQVGKRRFARVTVI